MPCQSSYFYGDKTNSNPAQPLSSPVDISEQVIIPLSCSLSEQICSFEAKHFTKGARQPLAVGFPPACSENNLPPNISEHLMKLGVALRIIKGEADCGISLKAGEVCNSFHKSKT
jgi:hypothetical protein